MKSIYVVCACALALSGLRAEAAAPTVMDQITVTGKAIEGASVTAAREEIQRAPGGVAVVGREAFEDRYALTLRDTLGRVPGVFAQPRFAEEVRLVIRGSGLGRNVHLGGVTLLQDGVPINLADGSGDFQEIDPAVIRHLEVYKGANGLVHGASSLGGAIVIETPTALTTEPYRFSVDGGSFETRRGNAQIARKGRGYDAFASVTLASAEGWRDNAFGRSVRGSGNLGIPLGQRGETRFYLAHNTIRQRLPGTRTRADALNDPRGTSDTNVANRAARDIESTRVSNRTTLAIGPGELALTGYIFDKALFHPLGFGIIDQTGQFFGGGVQYGVASGAHRTTVGVNLRDGDNDARLFAPLSGAGFAEQRSDNRERARHLSLYGQYEWAFVPDWTLISGVQVIRDTRDFTNRLNVGQSAAKTFDGVSPKLGVIFRPDEAHQLFANVSRSFEPPTFSELNQTNQPGNPGFVPLRAQKAWTTEVGARGDLGVLRYEISAYRAAVDDQLLGFSVDPAAGIPAATFNSDATVLQGVEAGASAPLWAHDAGYALAHQLAWTHNDFRFDDDRSYRKNRLAGVPRHLLVSELSLHTPIGITVRPQVEWSPSGMWVDFANTEKTPGYAVLNLSLSTELGQGLSAYIDGRNLLDRRYINSVSTSADFTALAPAQQAAFWPGEGRGIFVGLRWVPRT
ncbi:TonB-dependent receptor family protein [Polycyclovorans algicola]|uniref:TonB-dependent receptor family protein n=1 Tax=Polycyclovorans algicola TaxID=616992 RepID=UPI0004A6D99B|nr:TonB-dependent receptor [Polycyclovorans algicola]